MQSPLWQGVVYTKALHTGWKPKLQHRRMTLQQHQDVSVTVAARSLSCSSSVAPSCLACLQCAPQNVVPCMQVRDKFHIICEGDNLAPPVLQFEEMRMPKSIIRYLETKNIRRPTPIQMQAHDCLLIIL
jgi:hypothetical protein